jgi:hypothetical protein
VSSSFCGWSSLHVLTCNPIWSVDNLRTQTLVHLIVEHRDVGMMGCQIYKRRPGKVPTLGAETVYGHTPESMLHSSPNFQMSAQIRNRYPHSPNLSSFEKGAAMIYRLYVSAWKHFAPHSGIIYFCHHSSPGNDICFGPRPFLLLIERNGINKGI